LRFLLIQGKIRPANSISHYARAFGGRMYFNSNAAFVYGLIFLVGRQVRAFKTTMAEKQ
jgi:hypothetical protein